MARTSMMQGSGPLDRDEIVAHASFVRGVARGILADVAAADDLAQETLLKLLNAAPARSRAPRSLKAWLVRAVKNLAIQWRLADVRRATREEGSARREAEPATDALVQRLELHRRVVDATLALDDGQRAVVLLHYFEGASMAEVAQRLAIPLETARTRLKRALERLRARLEPEAGGRERLLLALLPVAGIDLFPAPLGAVAAPASVAGGGIVAGTLVTSLGAPLVMTTVGKLSLAAAPLLAVGAWWLLHEAPLDPSQATNGAGAIVRPEGPPPLAADPAIRADAEREADAPAAATEGTPAIDAALAAAGLGTVRVHVVAGSDRAIGANVGVRVVPEAEPHSIASAVRGNTNGEGLFVAQRVRAGWCVAAIAGFDTLPHWRWSHPDAAPGEAENDDRAETPAGESSAAFKLKPGATRDVELVVPEMRRIDGRVVDDLDHPVAGASIWVSDIEMAPVYGDHRNLTGFSARTSMNGQVVATSDAEGRFELRWIHQNTAVSAFAPGFAMSQKHELFGVGSRRSALTIRLDRTGTAVTGRVVDAAGAPIANAVVSVVLLQAPERHFEDGILRQDPAPRRERSGADGRFVVTGAPLDASQLAVVARGFAPSIQTITPSASGSNDFVVTLERGGTLTGTVRDEEGGRVAGLALGVWFVDDPISLNVDAMAARSDAHGDFTVDHLPAGRLRAIAADPHLGRTTTDFDVASGQTHRWDAVLSRGRPIRGRVVDERGAPLVHWQIVATPQDESDAHVRPMEARSDADGRFEFDGCTDVDHEVAAEHPDATGFSLGVTATVRPGGGEVLLTVRDADVPKCAIVGTLRAPEGFSTADAMLDVTQLGGPGTRTTLIGTTPHRFYSGPFPAGRYAVSMRISRLPTRDFGIHELAPGEDLDLGEVVFERPARVVVHARHADGTAVGAKELCVVRRDSPDRVALTRAGANLESGPLAAGRYLLCGDASSAGSVWQPFECAPGEALELTVTLEPAALRVFRFKPLAAIAGSAARTFERVTVRCLDEAGAELWSQTVASAFPGTLELRVRFTVGHWTLEATASDGSRAEFSVDVATLKDEEAAREVALR